MSKAVTKNIEIPEITDPLGRCWEQPDKSEMVFQENRVLMNEESIMKLKDYSHSMPTGAYIGKMWKRRCGDDWLLCWYGEHEDPNYVSNNQIPIKQVWGKLN